MIKKIFFFLLIAFVVIQFFHPAKNMTAAAQPHDIFTLYPASDSVKNILHKACYDCHSNNTRYPWYNNIQPAAWWMNSHVQEGKKHLNFNEFGLRPIDKQAKAFKGIAGTIRKNEMPLKSYTWIHRDAILSDAEKKAVTDWAKASGEKIK